MIKDPILKRKLLRVLTFGFFWFSAGLVYVILEKGLLGGLDHYPSTGNVYNFYYSLFLVPIASFFTGLVFGAMEIFVFNDLFRGKSVFFSVFVKAFLYWIMICLVLIGMTMLTGSLTLKLSIWHKDIFQMVFSFLFSIGFWSVVSFVIYILIISLFFSEISEYFGITTFMNFLIGKYQRPKREVRIFMFLDMKSSTTIAEVIGHVRYFELLKKYYADMSRSILSTEGRIYQYVGDEIVVSWTLKNGIKNNNCLKCYYGIKQAIAKKSHEYMSLYGVSPQFRAGIHVGEVTTGEIGKIKKDIISTGDVLNTTARIQELCKKYQVELLISRQLLELLSIEDDFQIAEMGEFLLKGKNQKIFINAVRQNKTALNVH